MTKILTPPQPAPVMEIARDLLPRTGKATKARGRTRGDQPTGPGPGAAPVASPEFEDHVHQAFVGTPRVASPIYDVIVFHSNPAHVWLG